MATYKHGDRVTCEIWGIKITDARISIDKDGTPFICQNEKGGIDAENKLGYKYSWALREDFTCTGVTNLRLEDGYNVGDVLVNGDCKYKILAIVGDVYFLSYYADHTNGGFFYTREALNKLGYKPLNTTETVEIAGKKYNKKEVEERVKELKEVK